MEKIDIYAVKHKNNDNVRNSRSGGFFIAISDYMLDHGGIVYGCILNEDFEAIHVRADNKLIRNKMCGSKYIQSKLGNIYQLVKKDLEENKLVLFTGTSCQIEGLKLFLKKDFDNLYCVDIVCHGVNSPKVYKNYLEWIQKKNKSEIDSIDFRNKKDFGWKSHIETVYFKNKKKRNYEIFKNLFVEDLILRPSCYNCPFKNLNHPGDITIADYWGVEKAAPEFDDNKGTSLVIINNKKGSRIFELLKENIKYKKTNIKDSMQPAFLEPSKMPKERNDFWRDFNCKDFDYIAKNYGGYNLKSKIIVFIKYFYKKIKLGGH